MLNQKKCASQKDWLTGLYYYRLFNGGIGRAAERQTAQLVASCICLQHTLSEENILRAKLVEGGCHVVVAPMEADVYIAKQGGTVVSRDSEFYIHSSIETMVKFNMNTCTRKIKLLEFNRTNLLETLK